MLQFLKRLRPRSTKELILELRGYLIATVGAVVFLWASQYWRSNEIRYEICRDIGIAFIVAIIVSMIYEVFARTRYDERLREGRLHEIMGELVHKDVWPEVRRQVIEKLMIREKAAVKVKLLRSPEILGPTSSQAVLWLDFSYELHGLRSRKKKVELIHNLDDHITCKEHHLPRFEDIVVGRKRYDCAGAARKSAEQLLKIKGTPLDSTAGVISTIVNPVLLKLSRGAELDVTNGVFRKVVELQPREANLGLRIETRRSELTYVPGSYNLTMGEMTQGITLDVLDLPSDIMAEVNIWPHTDRPAPLLVNQGFRRKDLLLLPGQTIEFRFKVKA